MAYSSSMRELPLRSARSREELARIVGPLSLCLDAKAICWSRPAFKASNPLPCRQGPAEVRCYNRPLLTGIRASDFFN